MADKDTEKKKGGFLSRLRSMGKQDCGSGCCGSIKIVPKEKKPEDEDFEQE